MTERFFILTPTPTGRTVKHPTSNNQMQVYLDASGKEMLWSADFPIPPIGARVFITMNGIGWARVKGYFVSECLSGDYVGVMTLATNPPTWLRRQHREEVKAYNKGAYSMPDWQVEGIGCEFGTEIALKRPKPRAKEIVQNA